MFWAATAGAAISSGAVAADIPILYRRAADIHHVPADLLYAMALAESGRTFRESHAHNLGTAETSGEDRQPWPWALNVCGRGAFFRDRRAAFRAVLLAMAQRCESIDIGLMQVNWRYHHHRLIHPWRALDPYTNLEAAADIFRECYDRLRDWWASVGCYHTPSNEQHATRYRERVRRLWRSVVGT